MFEHILIDRVLCLPALDVTALLQGRVVVVIPKISVQKGWTFALYACPDVLTESTASSYHPVFSSLVETAIADRSAFNRVDAWAKCEDCRLLHEERQIEVLSSSTIWSEAYLKQALQERQGLFLVSLRVYQLPQWIAVEQDCISSDKVGKFVSLSALTAGLSNTVEINQVLPILDSTIFQQRKTRLEASKPPLYAELEELCNSLAELSQSDPPVEALERDIASFLKWKLPPNQQEKPDSDLSWIQNIAAVGNSVDGNLFEKLVRRSFIELGFSNSRNDPKASLDPEATGGAGGIDFYCDAPFPVVGECKATKSEKIPSKTPGQLLQLGKNHLQEDYDSCIKVIIAAGELTLDAKLTSESHNMNVLRPETLQRLVELKAKHPGSIDLIELKICLEKSPFGEDADTKVNHFIDRVWQKLTIRANLVQAVKKLQELEPDQTQFEVSEIRVQYNTMFGAVQGNTPSKEAVYEILLELASPLAGYIGRIPSISPASDRFYFLRSFDLNM